MYSAYTLHERVSKTCEGASLAKQSFRDECDINNIMKKYEKSGLLEHVNTHKGDYGNFLNYEDYHTSCNKILEAQEAFLTIPSKIRAKFNNDPASFMDFAQDPENLDHMIEMGLAPARPPEASPDASEAPDGSTEPPPSKADTPAPEPPQAAPKTTPTKPATG